MSPSGGVDIEGADASWDFGFGAGFYVNAVEQKWAKHFRMYDYVTKELPQLVNANLPVDSARVSISGHSMGVTPPSPEILASLYVTIASRQRDMERLFVH